MINSLMVTEVYYVTEDNLIIFVPLESVTATDKEFLERSFETKHEAQEFIKRNRKEVKK